MWTIAICDDNERDRYNLEEILEFYCMEKGIAMESDLYYDGIPLYETMSLGKRYDIIFLDVLMTGMNGVAVGENIREKLDDEEVQIVYMSHGVNDAEALFENRPMKFLRKPFRRKRVFQIADYARKLNNRPDRRFWYQKKKVLYQVPYREIIYFQSLGRKIEIHTIGGKNEFYGKLSDVLERGLPEQFVQIHQSYIVNKNFIVELCNDRVYLEGEKGYISISKTFRQAATGHLKEFLMSDFVR